MQAACCVTSQECCCHTGTSSADFGQEQPEYHLHVESSGMQVMVMGCWVLQQVFGNQGELAVLQAASHSSTSGHAVADGRRTVGPESRGPLAGCSAE